MGQGSPQMRPAASEFRAAVHRNLVNMLTSSEEPRGGCGLTSAGLAHSVGVAFLEIDIVTRGAKTQAKTLTPGLPRFVDVKLSQEQKAAFVASGPQSAGWVVERLQELAFLGYRLGCSWSGEHQSYTVSLTCRDEESPNNGQCMTSFAGSLLMAIRLALYKHYEICHGVWVVPDPTSGEDFG